VLLNDVVRRGGFGGLPLHITGLPAELTGTACWSCSAVEYRRQPKGLNVNSPKLGSTR